jgi:murein DD-endopeptidase MepM/ murein hydrolase activator NlpD
MALDSSLKNDITKVAGAYGVPSNYLLALIQAESNFDNSAHSSAGAIGYTQLMPGTARGLGVNPYNPHENLIGGAKYLSQQLKKFNGNIRLALAAYNAGPGAVAKYGGIPPYAETQAYVKRVMEYARAYSSGQVGGIANAAPIVSAPSVETATSPLSPTLPSGPKFGVQGTSLRNPTLTIRPLSIQQVQAGSSVQDSGFGNPGSASVGYPLGVHGKIIGTPHSGTHNLGNWQSDNAVDIAVPIGTPVYAVSDGVIGSRIGSLGKGGRFAGLRVTLQGRNDSYYYAHLSKLRVKAGQRVRAGQLLGYSGSANGVAHLHFGVENGNVQAMVG